MDSTALKPWLIALLLVQLAGFALLAWRLQPPSPVETAVAPPPILIDPSTVVGATKLPDEQALRDTIRSVLQQELRAQREQLAAEAAPARASARARREARAEINPQVAQQSVAIVDRAVASGVWTDHDSAELLKLAPQLSEAQRVALLDKLFGAINRQQLKPTGTLPSL